ncbi:MAG: orotidine-5'-phosphate decarboxylase [Deltaproteobacteria bacterium]|nr:orotidine-5'-phosphate decarboxylase [Deltaproteobacteria bacterium]
MTAKDRLIVALDVNNAEEAESLVRLLAPEVGVFKVGLELFMAEGPPVVRLLKKAGARHIFLDLKLHDIPATMRAAARSAVSLGVDFLTCHCEQTAIFQDLDLGVTRLLGVTVLTSLGPEDLARLGYPPELTNPAELVLRRAALALEAGCHGVVCSGHEAQAVRGLLGPQALVVCPGIRPAALGVGDDDQKRVVTPDMAIKAGASHIVVGRPIRGAADPVKAAREVVRALASASPARLD